MHNSTVSCAFFAYGHDYTPFGTFAVVDDTGSLLAQNIDEVNQDLSTPSGNPYMYTGRRVDAESGFYYYRARYYEPHDGRFLAQDPIGVWGDPGNFGNAYAYVGNNPVMFTDPSGELLVQLIAGAVVGCGLGLAHEVVLDRKRGAKSSIAAKFGACGGGAVAGVFVAANPLSLLPVVMGTITATLVDFTFTQGTNKVLGDLGYQEECTVDFRAVGKDAMFYATAVASVGILTPPAILAERALVKVVYGTVTSMKVETVAVLADYATPSLGGISGGVSCAA